MTTTAFQAIFVIVNIGCFLLMFCEAVKASPREPKLDELDYDNSHPDGLVRHFAPRGHSSQGS